VDQDPLARITFFVAPHIAHEPICRSKPRVPASSRVLWLACWRTDIPSRSLMQSSQIGSGDSRSINPRTLSNTVITPLVPMV